MSLQGPPGAQSAPTEVYIAWKALPDHWFQMAQAAHTQKKGSAFFNTSGPIFSFAQE